VPEELAEPLEYFGGREGLCRELTSKILMYVYMGRNPDCPSEGEDPEPFTPPPPHGMRGDDRSEDSDKGRRGPQIIAHEVLIGPSRVEVSTVRRLTREDKFWTSTILKDLENHTQKRLLLWRIG